MSIKGLPTNPKHSIGLLPSDVFDSTSQCDRSDRITFEIKKIVSVLSETVNRLSQFMITIIIQSFETSEFTLLKWLKNLPPGLKKMLRFAVLRRLKI